MNTSTSSKYKVNRSKFPNPPSDTEDKKKKTKLPTRFNIRIKQEDLSLLDALAEHHEMSRSSLLNSLVYGILQDELRSVEDMDSRVLLATSADELFQADKLSTSWISDVFQDEMDDMKQQYLDFGEYGTGTVNHSDTFQPLKDRIKVISK